MGIRYRGIDGEFWPREEYDPIIKNEWGLAEQGEVPKILRILERNTSESQEDLVHIAVLGSHSRPRNEGRLLGFDFGYYESPDNKYSVVLNEVIFGAYDELRKFAGELNEHLLLPNRESARFLAAARENLVRGGLDLETDLNCALLCMSLPRLPER